MLSLTMIMEMFLLMWKQLCHFTNEAKLHDDVRMNVPFVPPFTMDIKALVAPCTFGFQPFNEI